MHCFIGFGLSSGGCRECDGAAEGIAAISSKPRAGATYEDFSLVFVRLCGESKASLGLGTKGSSSGDVDVAFKEGFLRLANASCSETGSALPLCDPFSSLDFHSSSLRLSADHEVLLDDRDPTLAGDPDSLAGLISDFSCESRKCANRNGSTVVRGLECKLLEVRILARKSRRRELFKSLSRFHLHAYLMSTVVAGT